MRPTLELMMDAVRAGLYLRVQYNTGGETETVREVIPVAVGTRNGKIYWRGIHLNGGSASNAGSNVYRLFLLDGPEASDSRTLDIKQLGKTYSGTDPNITVNPAGAYRLRDSFFGSLSAVYNPKTSILFYNREKNRIRNIFR